MAVHAQQTSAAVNYTIRTAVPKTSDFPVQRKQSPVVHAGATKSTNQDQHTSVVHLKTSLPFYLLDIACDWVTSASGLICTGSIHPSN
jgi:hypothetical protein